MRLQPGMRVAFTAAHCKQTMASPAKANRRGTFRGLDTAVHGYCRVTWDDGPWCASYGADPEYCAMARNVGELHPLAIICGVKSVGFIDTYA